MITTTSEARNSPAQRLISTGHRASPIPVPIIQRAPEQSSSSSGPGVMFETQSLPLTGTINTLQLPTVAPTATKNLPSQVQESKASSFVQQMDHLLITGLLAQPTYPQSSISLPPLQLLAKVKPSP